MSDADMTMKCSGRLPQFLIISPPKTGSTWLADNLRHHPHVFIPAIKEVKYFSSLHHWLDLDWYRSHFDAPDDRIAGEASPSYAALPAERIRAIRELIPDVKIVFLMRDPVSRAWSHARHMHRFREGCFAECTKSLDQVTDPEWLAAFEDEWLLASGDYLGQLRRWLAVFPREQVHIGFFESILERPAELLRGVLSFLGADADIDLSRFPLAERILPGPDAKLTPHLEERLRSLLANRTEEPAAFMLTPPEAWQRTLVKDDAPARTWRFDDADLSRIAAREVTFRTSYRQLFLNDRGFDILFYRGRLLAVPSTMSRLEDLDSSPLEERIRAGTILTAATLDELKERVSSRSFEMQEQRLRELERDLRCSREEAARLRIDLQTLVHEVRHPAPPVWKRVLYKLRQRIRAQ